MKPVNLNLSTYIDCDKKNNKKDLKFNVGNHTRVYKYKNIFAKRFCSKVVSRSLCN